MLLGRPGIKSSVHHTRLKRCIEDLDTACNSVSFSFLTHKVGIMTAPPSKGVVKIKSLSPVLSTQPVLRVDGCCYYVGGPATAMRPQHERDAHWTEATGRQKRLSVSFSDTGISSTE